jgi:hypothetical protein
MLNFGKILTDYEVNIMDFDVSFVMVGCMKDIPFKKKNASTA